jgi:hypothetical protein
MRRGQREGYPQFSKGCREQCSSESFQLSSLYSYVNCGEGSKGRDSIGAAIAQLPGRWQGQGDATAVPYGCKDPHFARGAGIENMVPVTEARRARARGLALRSNENKIWQKNPSEIGSRS